MNHTFLVNGWKEIEAKNQADAMEAFRILTGCPAETCLLQDSWNTPGFEERLRALNQGA